MINQVGQPLLAMTWESRAHHDGPDLNLDLFKQMKYTAKPEANNRWNMDIHTDMGDGYEHGKVQEST